MVVSGFIEPLVKELPMEYAVEMNKLIQLQMTAWWGRRKMRNNLRALLNHNTPELPSELIERLALQSSPKAHEFRTNAWQQAQNLPFPDKDEAWHGLAWTRFFKHR